MKKLLYAALLLGALSCTKDKSVCWDCTFGIVNGVQRPPETICNDGYEPGPFQDSQGNDLSYSCHKEN